MVPIAYAPAGGQLHRDLADYKRAAEPAVPDLIARLAQLLSGFLAAHERCVLNAAGLVAFDCISAVPSGSPHRDALHPLRHIVGDLIPETRGRYRDLLRAGGEVCPPHSFQPRRFSARADPGGAHVLLIDDVWTTGATAQSAAAVLLAAGAASVSAVVVGRYVNGSWGGIDRRLAAMGAEPGSGHCGLCAPEGLQSVAPRASYTPDSPQGGRSSVG